MKQLLLMVMSLVCLVSCKDFVEEIAPKEKEVKKIEVKQVKRELLLEKALLKDQLSLGKVKNGDLLEVKFRGKKFVPQYTDVYEKSLQSRWTERRCYRDSGAGDGHSVRVCEDYDETGHCIHLYRDTLPTQEIPLSFDSPINELKIKIGSNVYPLTDIVQNDGPSMIAQLRISREMLSDSNEAFLYVEPAPSQEIRMGFQGFGHCEGQGNTNFQSGGYQTYDMVDMRPRYEFVANAWLVEQ